MGTVQQLCRTFFGQCAIIVYDKKGESIMNNLKSQRLFDWQTDKEEGQK